MMAEKRKHFFFFFQSLGEKRCTWAARYNTSLLIKLMPKGAGFSFLFLRSGVPDLLMLQS
jgi:hypothetical protein